MLKPFKRATALAALFAFIGIAGQAAQVSAQDACKNRGDLDALYCDENNDLVADTPKDVKKLKTPGTLVFTYTPVEDPAVYEKVFKPLCQAELRENPFFVFRAEIGVSLA